MACGKNPEHRSSVSSKRIKFINACNEEYMNWLTQMKFVRHAADSDPATSKTSLRLGGVEPTAIGALTHGATITLYLRTQSILCISPDVCVYSLYGA